jgi:hypothetical protein
MSLERGRITNLDWTPPPFGDPRMGMTSLTCALRIFESMGCIVDVAQPDYPVDAVWSAWLRLQAWQSGGALLTH